MTRYTGLTNLAKVVARELGSGNTAGVASLGDALASLPNGPQLLLDLIVKESAKKRSNDRLVSAYLFMLGQLLETLRYAIERNFADAAAEVDGLRIRLLTDQRLRDVEPGLLMLVLRQFVSAKLDLGEALQAMMGASMADMEPTALPNASNIASFLDELLQSVDGDIFAFYADFAENTATFPDDHRAGVATTLLSAKNAALREASIGLLLDRGRAVRNAAAAAFAEAAKAKMLSGTMLRRMVTVRNWLPVADRPLMVTTQRKADVRQTTPFREIRVAWQGITSNRVQSFTL